MNRRPRRIAFLSEHASPLALLGGEDAGGQNVYIDEVSVVRAVDLLIAQCPSECAELVDDYGADPRKVVVIPSAVNTETFRPVPRDEARRALRRKLLLPPAAGLDTHELIVVYVGRM